VTKNLEQARDALNSNKNREKKTKVKKPTGIRINRKKSKMIGSSTKQAM
jgi:hypothetical protein